MPPTQPLEVEADALAAVVAAGLVGEVDDDLVQHLHEQQRVSATPLLLPIALQGKGKGKKRDFLNPLVFVISAKSAPSWGRAGKNWTASGRAWVGLGWGGRRQEAGGGRGVTVRKREYMPAPTRYLKSKSSDQEAITASRSFTHSPHLPPAQKEPNRKKGMANLEVHVHRLGLRRHSNYFRVPKRLELNLRAEWRGFRAICPP